MNHSSAIVRKASLYHPAGGGDVMAFLAGFNGISALLFVLTLFVVWFFRNPERTLPENPRLVISPADGKVIRIEETTSDDHSDRSFQKISIFMNVFNVHVNRIPCSGAGRFHPLPPGKFLSANLDKASALNERNTVLIQTDDGREIMTVQIAGSDCEENRLLAERRDAGDKGNDSV